MVNVIGRTRPSISCRFYLMLHLVCCLLPTSVRVEDSRKISVRQGESFILSPINGPVKDITLYKNGETNYTKIVTWKNDNGTIVPFWGNNYTSFRKISMDGQAFWIENFDKSYIGKYCFHIPGHNESCLEVELDKQGSQESDQWILSKGEMTGLIVGPVVGTALSVGIAIICLIHTNKKIQACLWKRVFKTYLEKLTVKQDIQEWLNSDFSYVCDERLPTGGPRHSDYGVPQSGPYEAEDQRQRQIATCRAKFSPNLERVNFQLAERQTADSSLIQSSAVQETYLLLPEGQADQPSGPQEHELHILPPGNLPCSSNLVLDSNEVSSSEA